MASHLLVVRGGAIGDFILTLPVLAALRRHFPVARLELLAVPRIAALAGPLADRIQSLDSAAVAGLFVPAGVWPAEISSWLSPFELIVSYLYDPDRTFQTNIRRCTAARFLAGPHRPEESASRHATEILFEPLASLGITNPGLPPQIVLPSRPLPPGRWIAVHPGSGSERKNWPEARWAELLQHLMAGTPWNILLIGGEAEGHRPSRLASALPAHRFLLARDLPLTQLAGQMKSCAAFLGHDSGITHLAAALNLPGVILWGDTNQTVWRPCNQRLRLLSSPRGLKNLSVKEVCQASQILLDSLTA